MTGSAPVVELPGFDRNARRFGCGDPVFHAGADPLVFVDDRAFGDGEPQEPRFDPKQSFFGGVVIENSGLREQQMAGDHRFSTHQAVSTLAPAKLRQLMARIANMRREQIECR